MIFLSQKVIFRSSITVIFKFVFYKKRLDLLSDCEWMKLEQTVRAAVAAILIQKFWNRFIIPENGKYKCRLLEICFM